MGQEDSASFSRFFFDNLEAQPSATMTTRTLWNLLLVVLFVMAILYVKMQWNTEAWQNNPAYSLISIIVLAGVAGIVFVLVVLPRFGDAVGEAMYSSGERISQHGTMKAAARVSAGDYDGAIDEYLKVLEENPEDPFPISEIAKIQAEKFRSPDLALSTLQEHLEAKEWTTDNAAFLMFRMMDMFLLKHDYADARDILEQVCTNFPDTRHSANARHKMNDIDQLEFRALQANRNRAVQTAPAVQG